MAAAADDNDHDEGLLGVISVLSIIAVVLLWLGLVALVRFPQTSSMFERFKISAPEVVRWSLARCLHRAHSSK